MVEPASLLEENVFVQPRRLVANDINRLPSPSDWSHAFPSSANRPVQVPSNLSTSNSITVNDSNSMSLPVNASEDDDKHLVDGWSRPRRQEYTFKIGKSVHSGFSNAIAALMLRTNQETDLLAEEIICRTPVSDELYIGPDPEFTDENSVSGVGGVGRNDSGQSLVNGGDDTENAILPTANTISHHHHHHQSDSGFESAHESVLMLSTMHGTGAAFNSMRGTAPILGGLSLVPMQFSMSLPNPGMRSSDGEPLKRGRFEVRRLESL